MTNEALISQNELTVSGRGAPDSVRFGLDVVNFHQGDLGRRQSFARFYGAPNTTRGNRPDAAPAVKSPAYDPADRPQSPTEAQARLQGPRGARDARVPAQGLRARARAGDRQGDGRQGGQPQTART